MTTFKPGDRVRLSAQAGARRRAALGSAQGIVQPDPEPTGGVLVEWEDHDRMWNYPQPHEIELVTPAKAYTAAELRTRAAEMRNLRDEKYADAERLCDEANALDSEARVYEQAATALEKIK